jgi:hypothetical protein
MGLLGCSSLSLSLHCLGNWNIAEHLLLTARKQCIVYSWRLLLSLLILSILCALAA